MKSHSVSLIKSLKFSMIKIYKYWRNLRIARKFTTGFSLLLFLMILVSITSYWSLHIVQRKTQSAILVSTEIQRLVLTMAHGLQSARVYHRDFFLQYPEMGFAQARDTYAQKTVQNISEVIRLSNQLKDLISKSEVSDIFANKYTDINLFLSSAQRYADTFLGSVDLVTELAAEDTGLLAQMNKISSSIHNTLENKGNELFDLYIEIKINEQQYFLTRNRPFMQTAFNTIAQIIERIEASDNFNDEERQKILNDLVTYQNIAEQILAIDVQIRSNFRDFELQAESIDPIAEELVNLASLELERSRQQIQETSRAAQIILVIAILSGLMLAIAIAKLLNHSITNNIVNLTQVAKELQRGNWKQRATIDSRDELGLLAVTFNTMADRIYSLVGNLEQQVSERTEALVQSNQQLQQEVLVRQKAQEAAHKSQKAAEVANQAKSEFLANMSHELRTPLNGILGYTQILLRDRSASPSQLAGVKIIHDCGTHLLNLINDILDLSKIEARKLELCPQPLELSTFLTGVIEICRIRAEQKEIAFNYQNSTPLPQAIIADEKRLRQVLINLLGNAIKFTDQGEVCLTVETLDEQESDPPIVRLQFQIQDTGIGMTQEQIERIFLPFEQVGDRQRMAEGTGLGLAITHTIVQMMGSKLSVHSQINQGSTFEFDIFVPVATTWTQMPSEETEKAIAGYVGPQRCILVVDDSWENRSVIADLITPLGFNVLEASNGQEGLQKAVEALPDAIITDIIMPIMNGLEMTRQLRKLSEFEKIPIIASSASVFNMNRQNTHDSGCDEFIPKPVQAKELVDKIGKCLGLQWIYEEAIESPQDLHISGIQSELEDVNLIYLPREELATLKEAVAIGDVENIQRTATRLTELSPKFTAIANQLLQLAEEFDMDKIKVLVNQYISE
ncbi:MAG: response regulator [Arthrospira sp. PLM2.Bin9]|nr:MAG: response regulator [Arthrospira sp. PLM2.Bin9]